MPLFEPRRVFRRASHPALRSYFRHREIDLDVAWDDLDPDEWQPLCDAWHRLADQDHALVAADFHEVDIMTSETGIKALNEQGRLAGIDLMPLWQTSEHDLDFVLQVFTEHHDTIWLSAARFAVADQLDGGRSWQRYDGLPLFRIDVSDEAQERLAEGLSGYFRAKEGRGQYCLVEHAQRENGQHYYFAYLSDYPMARERFDEAGHLLRGVDHGVFVVIFASSEVGGVVNVCAPGGRSVRDELLRIFGRCVPGVELEPDPDRAAGRYHLGQFKRRRTLTYDPTVVNSAVIRRVSVRAIGGPNRSMTLSADPSADPLDIYTMIYDWLNQRQIPITNLELTSVTFSITLPPDKGTRERSFTFYATRTGKSDLRSKKEAYRATGEQLLEDWGVIDVRRTGRADPGDRAAS